MGFFATLFKDAEEQPAVPSQTKTGINAILLGPPGSGKGTQVSANRSSGACYVIVLRRRKAPQSAAQPR